MSRLIRILYCDDNPLDHELVRDALTKAHAGFELIEAASRADFEAALVNGDFDIVLSDFNILGFVGLQVLEAVHAQDPNLPVVIVTGAGSEEIAAEAMRRGASDYVIKTPQHLQRLPQTLRAVLDNKRTKEAQREIEQQYRTLFETTPIGIGIADLEGNLLTFNDAILLPGGYTRDDIKKIGGVAGLYSDPGQRHEALVLLKKQGFLHNHPVQFKRKDGTVYEAVLTLTPVVFQGIPCLQALVEDVTHRKQAEAALRNAEARYRVLFEQSPDGILLIDVETGKTLEANETAHKQLGYTREEFAALRISDYEALEKPEETAKRMQKIISEGSGDFETLHRAKSGEIRNVHVWAKTLPLGERVVFYAIFQDITERVWTEQALRENEQRLQVALKSVNMAVFHQDRALRYTWMYQPQLGYRFGQVVGHTDAELLPPEAARRVTEIKRRVLEMGVSAHEAVSVAAEGATFVYDLVAEPLRDASGAIIGLTGATLDITERKRVEEALRESETKHKAMIQNIPGMVYRAYSDWTAEIVSNAVALCGYTNDEVNAMPRGWLTIVHPDDRDVVEKEGATLVRERRTLIQSYRIIVKNGQTRWVEDHKTSLFSEAGAFDGLEGVVLDITERKRAEEALRESEERFRALIEHSYDAVTLLAADGTVLYDSPSIARVLGYETTERIGRRVFEFVHPDERQNMAQGFARFAPQTGAVASSEVRFIYKDGTPRWIEGVRTNLLHEPAVRAVVVNYRDITERKRAEAALQQSHELLANLARRVPGVIYQYRLYPDGRSAFPYSSPGMNEIYEVTPEEVREDATPVFRRLHPDDYDRVANSIQESARTLQTFYCEFRVILPWQGLRWRWSQAHPERTVDGGTLWHGIISDITERKRAEEKIAASESQLRALFASMNDVVIIYDTDGRYVGIAPTNPANLYRPSGEMLGKTVHEILPKEQADYIISRIRESIQTGQVVNGEYSLRIDGREVWFASSASRLSESTAIWVAHDITNRKQALKAQRQAEAKYQDIFENAVEGIFQSSPTGKFFTVNPALARMLGYDSPKELIAGVNDLYHEFYVQPTRRTEFVRQVSHYGLIANFESEVYRKDGSTIWISENARAVRDEAGQVVYYEGTLEDVTERKEAEAKLAATNARLEQAVWEANQLAIAAQAANRLKSEILANTSHELRTPLTGILGSLGLILEGLCDTRAEERSFIVTAYQSSCNLLELINNLLDLAKIEAGKMEVELQPVDLAVALAEVETLARAQALEKGLVLRVAETPGRTLWAKADPEKVRQILLNVVNNAIKFTEQGEVEIAARADPQAGVVRLTVRDTGIGVPLEQQAKLFQPFVQVDGTSTRRYGGSGLGLSLSRQFAELMSGRLTLESAGAGQGCTLTLTLPCGTATGLPLAQ